jgi:hypothetical protein
MLKGVVIDDTQLFNDKLAEKAADPAQALAASGSRLRVPSPLAAGASTRGDGAARHPGL